MDALIETKDFYKAYKKMHWDRTQSFSGFGVLGEAEELKDIVELYEAQTVLDMVLVKAGSISHVDLE